MIEKYFLQGVRFKWACPKDDQKGSKDGSVILSDPKVVTPDLIYDGLDGDLVNPSVTNVTQLGFKMGMKVPYQWLVYSVGHTTKRMLSAGDCLTGYMSGCLITMWQEDGMRYIGHVGTVDGNDKINKAVRSTFAGYMPDDACGFNPAGAWSPKEIEPMMKKLKGVTPRILALVTAKGAFHSILMFQFPVSKAGAGDWCVGGIKHVPPLNPAQLKKALTA